MAILFRIGMAIWFLSVAAMFLSRALETRKSQAFAGSFALCGVGSVILAITTPAVSGASTTRNVLVSIVFAALALLCAAATLILRRSPTEQRKP
ncbi:DUF4149 domain-containing protein [Nocardia spumae]|uniref:DUF4149 domain-containing protein n=1 Tax=Nocardia spumae TaxID=2887190 RepID=UPI001D13CBF5|nr:DUF4149 domain-containing protein [Nocardia spumae]